MTRDEILNMPAGRKMDLLIARILYPEATQLIIMPKYSTDIAAAWEVVEFFHPNFSVDLSYDDPQTVEEIKWCCELCANKEPYDDFEARADTAPLAICRAALLATMDENTK